MVETWTRGTVVYGIYPILSENVLIEDCEVSGASDAGYYVGLSTNVLLRRNVAFGNPVLDPAAYTCTHDPIAPVDL